MKILIVSATKHEVEPLIERMESVEVNGRLLSGRFKQSEIVIVITGVGMVATAYYTGSVLDDSYDVAFNMGICGSFNTNLKIGDVVNIHEDTFAELGAEDGENFLTLDELKLEGISKIVNDSGAIHAVVEVLPRVSGITVNTTHGNEKNIQKVFDRFHPYVESMEGAAFMFVCENERIPYVQIRAVSNYVEKRNRDTWNIPLAIEKLNEKMFEILNSLQ
jgi:futalosine hydrolase